MRRVLSVCCALLGCGSAAADVSVPAAPSGSAGVGASVPAPDDVPKLPAWEWHGASALGHEPPPPDTVAVSSGGSCRAKTQQGEVGVTCELPSGTWTQKVADGSHRRVALAASQKTLFAVVFSAFSTGAEAQAYDLATGRALWKHRLTGCGPIGHSEYFNAVRARTEGRHLVVFGSEVACRYVELVHAEKGETLKHEPLPAQY